MIKLNNKNITYVALADSNNSLKAPKEIWYADSSNSVKLVYRRKDALIEGEDYEKYHWLCGRNGAYINTKYELTPFDDAFYVKAKYDGSIKNPDNDEQYVFGMRNYVSSTDRYYCVTLINAQNKIAPRYCNLGSDNPVTDEVTNLEVFLSADANYMYRTLNGVAYPAYSHDGTFVLKSDKAIYLFKANFTDSPQLAVNKYFHGDISSFRISDPAFTIDKVNMIPCKLLKPVPKWLDANGIRRQVGECGMIDLVSGKFYGNVNSVGTFTVENYYERKEWLIGDGSAYIDTNVIIDVATLLISTKIKRSNSTGNYFIFGSRDIMKSDDPSTSSVVVSPQSFRCDIINGNNIFDSSSIASIELSFPTLTINGQSSTTQRVPTTSQNTFRIFTTSVVNSETYCFNGGISRFVLNDSSYRFILVPCTLTMDLPASMDANNIARVKGESGMWDLVSDRFYGNVASSGTFKAVNLAEGVDYEVHQWLVGEISSKGTLQRLPINSSSMSYRAKRINGVNLHFFRTEGNYDYYYASSNYRVSIWDLNQRTLVYRNQSIIVDEFDFECSAGNVYVNGVDIPIYGFPIKEVRFHGADNGGVKISTSSITVDGIERYIPVKLLKSIPSTYDANGIARQAGECGMYDTVNDVFYGNVASSGTFSVSDDS